MEHWGLLLQWTIYLKDVWMGKRVIYACLVLKKDEGYEVIHFHPFTHVKIYWLLSGMW